MEKMTPDPAQSAPSAEQLANAEHDRLFPPRGQDESAHDFLIRALAEHSNSHMTWVTYYENNPEKQGKVSEGHSLEYQKRCIFRYNQIFRAFKELNEAAALRTAQLERELQDSDKEGDDILKAFNDVSARFLAAIEQARPQTRDEENAVCCVCGKRVDSFTAMGKHQAEFGPNHRFTLTLPAAAAAEPAPEPSRLLDAIENLRKFQGNLASHFQEVRDGSSWWVRDLIFLADKVLAEASALGTKEE